MRASRSKKPPPDRDGGFRGTTLVPDRSPALTEHVGHRSRPARPPDIGGEPGDASRRARDVRGAAAREVMSRRRLRTGSHHTRLACLARRRRSSVIALFCEILAHTLTTVNDRAFGV